MACYYEAVKREGDLHAQSLNKHQEKKKGTEQCSECSTICISCMWVYVCGAC
jgi:hypothetical protein